MWRLGPHDRHYDDFNRGSPSGPVLYQVFILGDIEDAEGYTETIMSTPQVESIEELPSECMAAIRLLEAAARDFSDDGKNVQVLANIDDVGYIRYIHSMSNRDYYIYKSFLEAEEHYVGDTRQSTEPL